MYVFKDYLTLPTNASPFNNNIALRYSKDAKILADFLAVVNNNHFNVIPINLSTHKAKLVPLSREEGMKYGIITQVKWVELDYVTYFVVLSSKGLQIYDNDINNIIFYHAMQEYGDNKSYSIGICSIKNKILVVGTHLGTVWLFEPIENGTNFKLLNRVFAHDEAVTLLEGLGSCMVSSSDFSTYLWNYRSTNDFNIIRKFDVFGLTGVPTSIKLKFGLIGIGYSSGEICFFDVNEEKFSTRTPAHMLKITSLDFQANLNVITASDDCYVKIWKLDHEKENVSLLETIFNEEGPVYGVGFLNFISTEFCVITGGENKVKCFINWDHKLEEVQVNKD